jgi:hypothetical protein
MLLLSSRLLLLLLACALPIRVKYLLQPSSKRAQNRSPCSKSPNPCINNTNACARTCMHLLHMHATDKDIVPNTCNWATQFGRNSMTACWIATRCHTLLQATAATVSSVLLLLLLLLLLQQRC